MSWQSGYTGDSKEFKQFVHQTFFVFLKVDFPWSHCFPPLLGFFFGFRDSLATPMPKGFFAWRVYPHVNAETSPNILGVRKGIKGLLYSEGLIGCAHDSGIFAVN